MSARAVLAAVVCSFVLGGCGRLERLEACNVATEECQVDIYYAVMRVRGDGWDPFDGLPPIRTLTLAQYAKELEKQAAPIVPPAPDQEPKLDPWSVALQLLGVVTPTMTSGQAAATSRIANVAAFYTSSTGKVTVIDRGNERNDRADTTLLAHELVHALQDNEVSGAIGGGTSDGTFTARAQIEGEAVLYENLIDAEIGGYEPQQIDWEGYFGGMRDNRRAGMSVQPSPFYEANWFVYPYGAGLMTRAWLEGGNAAVRALGSSFPRHAAQLMATSDREQPVEMPSTLSCEVTGPSSSFALAGADRFGGMQLYAFLVAQGMLDEAEAWKRGKRWRDDAMWVFLDEAAQQVVVTWRVRLADEKSAGVVVDVASQREGLRAERIGKDALIVGSNDEELLESWPGARDCAR